MKIHNREIIFLSIVLMCSSYLGLKGQHDTSNIGILLAQDADQQPDSTLYSLIAFTTRKWQETVRSNIDSSLIYAVKSSEYAKELKNDSLLFQAYRRAATTLIQQGEMEEARAYCGKMRPLFNDDEYYAGFRYFNTLGQINYYEGNYEEALANHLTSLSSAEAGNLLNNIPAAYGEIARVFDDMGQPIKALEYGKKDVAFTMEHGGTRGKFIANYNLANKYGTLDSFKQALTLYELSDSLGKELNIPVFNAALALSRGGLLVKMGEENQAIPMLNSAEQTMDKAGNLRGKLSARLQLAKAFNQLQQYNKALEILEDLYIQLQAEAYEELLENCRKQYAEALYQTGNGGKAFEIYREFKEIQDSVKNEGTRKAINELDIKYQSAEKERIINAQQLELERGKYYRKLLLGGLAMAIWFGAFLVIYFWYRNKTTKKIALQDTRIQEQKILQLEQEKNLLAMSSMIEGQEVERKRIAMDLHDGLGGILTNIKSQLRALEQKVDAIADFDLYGKATGMIDNASKEVRRIAYNMMPLTLSKLGLKAAVEDLALSLGQSNKLNIKTHISGLDERLDETKEVFIYRIIQELANNAVKHSEATNLFIQLDKVGNDILVAVEDNGIGFDVDSAKRSEGIGMKSVASRVKFLGGTMDLSSDSKGTSFNIHIPGTTV